MNLSEYAESLKSNSYRVLDGSGDTIWVSHGRFAMQRQPVFALHVPSEGEIRETFKKSHVPLLSFTVAATERWPANSCLYLCRDPEYSLQKLGQSARSHLRRGLNEFNIRFLEQDELLRSGAQAYCDTHYRTGLSGDTPEAFHALFSQHRPDRRYLGALKGDRLAAFLLVTEVDDWVSIGGYSANEFLPLRPNNALVYYVVHHYLVERKFRVVSYGLSSIQAVSNEAGLERFKLKMGFESSPVHRAFVVHPLLRPLVNRASWGLANAMLKLSPQNMMLKKAEGALRMAMMEYQPLTQPTKNV